MRPSPAPIATLSRCLSRRGRVLLGLIVVLALGGRISVLATALAAARGDAAQTVALGVATASLFAVGRVALLVGRAGLERDLCDATARALVHADVLGPGTNTHRISEGVDHATSLWSTTIPTLVADVAVCAAVVPFVLGEVAPRALALAALALVLTIGSVLLVRRPAARVEARVMEAREKVFHGLLAASEARLELVACGAEREFVTRFSSLLSSYERVVQRSAVLSAMLGRTPLVAGALGVALAVAIDGASREVLTAAIIGQAVVLAACIPPVMGTVLGAHALVRSSALVAPLVEVLSEPPRPGAGQSGRPLPPLPARVDAEGLSFRYAKDEPLVLEGVTFEWPAGEPLVLVGPNGSGKSTLLRLLVGLRPPTSGTIRIAGEDLGELDGVELRRRSAYLPQRPYLGEPYVSVRAAMTVTCPDVADGVLQRALERTEVMHVLRQRGGADGALDVPVGELSTGQRQRVALARVLLHDARVVLLDEPDANLDPAGVALVADLVRELTREGRMVALAAHSPELAAISACRVVLGGGDSAFSSDPML